MIETPRGILFPPPYQLFHSRPTGHRPIPFRGRGRDEDSPPPVTVPAGVSNPYQYPSDPRRSQGVRSRSPPVAGAYPLHGMPGISPFSPFPPPLENDRTLPYPVQGEGQGGGFSPSPRGIPGTWISKLPGGLLPLIPDCGANQWRSSLPGYPGPVRSVPLRSKYIFSSANLSVTE